MNLSSSLIRIAYLALPGLIGSFIYRSLTGKNDKKDWESFVQIFLFSLTSYAIFGWVSSIILNQNITLKMFSALYDETQFIDWFEITCSSFIGIVLGFGATAVNTYKVLYKVGQKLKVTNRDSDEDVWTMFNSSSEIEYVVVRDHKLDLSYCGHINSFSESSVNRELLLENIYVYSNTSGKHLYELKALYISRERYDLSIEVFKEYEDSNQDNSQRLGGGSN